MKQALENAIKHVSKMNYAPVSTVSILYGLNRMGYKWKDLSEDTQLAVSSMLTKSVRNFDGMVSDVDYCI
jgi:hypothetical protein